jgi:alkylation response protein AidB-like acyl-CoA dehydrogenase
MMTLDRARPGVAAQGVGLAQGALDYADASTRWSAAVRPDHRMQFQMIQFMLADMSRAGGGLALARLRRAPRNIDERRQNVNKLAAQAKLFATDTAMKVATDAVQMFGGYGYMQGLPVEKYMRDAKITQIYEGTNQVQRIVIARNLMKGASALSHLEDYMPLPGTE